MVSQAMKINGDYTDMADFYDIIMTSGYYDYSLIVDGFVESFPKPEEAKTAFTHS
jgi:hypothetical protein